MQRNLGVLRVEIFYYVSILQNVLTEASWSAWELIVGSDVVDKRIVQSLAQFVGQGVDVGKYPWIAENKCGNVGVQGGGKGKGLHKDLIFHLLGLECSVEAPNAAIDWLSFGEVSINGIASEEDRNGIHRDRFGLRQRVQLGVNKVDVDQGNERSVGSLKEHRRTDGNFYSDGNQCLGMAKQHVETVVSIVVAILVE